MRGPAPVPARLRLAVVAVTATLLVSGCVLTTTTAGPAEPPGGGGGGVLEPGTVPAAFQTWVITSGHQCGQIVAPLLAAQVQVESGWNPAAVSPAGAQGLAQFMPGTWPGWGRDDDHNGRVSPFDPGDAIMAQGRFMCYLLTATTTLTQTGAATGDPTDLALAAYNAGLAAVAAFGGIPPFPETQAYIPKIRALQDHYTAHPHQPPDSRDGVGARIVAYAVGQLGAPYVWGGGTTTGPSGLGRDGRGPGFDCSGLVLYAVYQATGITLAHWVPDQINRTGTIAVPARLTAMRPGDLIGFSLHSRLDHIGIYAGHGQMINAPRTGRNVEYARLTDPYWANKTWTVRRLP